MNLQPNSRVPQHGPGQSRLPEPAFLVVTFGYRETLNKGGNALAELSKSLIFRGSESTIRNYSDGVSRFRRSWLEGEVTVLHTDNGNEVRAGRPQRSKEEELP